MTIIKSRAPLRLGLAGGGSDLSPYCDIYGGHVVNCTLDRYCYTVIKTLDEPNIRFLLEQTLEDLEDEYDVTLLTAENGRDGLEIIQEHRPELVLLDVMMPFMSGLEVCEAIRKDPVLQDTKVIMLTAKGQVNDKDHGMQAGADLYLTKPFQPTMILEQVLEVLTPKLSLV